MGMFDNINRDQLDDITLLVGMATIGVQRQELLRVAMDDRVDERTMCAGMLKANIGAIVSAMAATAGPLGYESRAAILKDVQAEIEQEFFNPPPQPMPSQGQRP